MTGRLLKQPWVILTLLGVTVVFAASVYDARREPIVKRQLRRADIALSVEELKARYSPEPWEQNGAKFYLQAMRTYREPERSTWEHLVIAGDLQYDYGHVFTGEQRDALRAYVTANTETIALVLKAQECPFTRLTGDRYNLIQEYLGQSRALARLVACAALDTALSGDMASMDRMIVAGLRLPEIMTEGGLLIDALVAKGLCTIAFDALENCLYYVCPPSDILHSWLLGLDTEMNTTYRWLREIFNNETTFQYQVFEYEGPCFDWPKRLYWQRTLKKLELEWTQFSYFIQNGYVLNMKSIIAATEKHSCDLDVTPEEELREAGWSGNARNPYAFMGFDINRRLQTIAGNNIAQAAAVRAALATLLYLEDHGKMPETLEALTPGYLPLPAYDPFTRAALLHFRLDDDQALFYSVGPNKKDDGGTEAGQGKSILESGDIIFRLPIENTENIS